MPQIRKMGSGSAADINSRVETENKLRIKQNDPKPSNYMSIKLKDMSTPGTNIQNHEEFSSGGVSGYKIKRRKFLLL